jgi:AbrB family looped-hinge helix DNA binding protein
MRMRVTSMGRVTIPKVVRDRFGMMPGTDVDFFFEDGALVIRKRADQESANAPELARRAGREPKPRVGKLP